MISSFRIRIGRITFNAVNYYTIKMEHREAMNLKKMLDRMKKKKTTRQVPKLLEKGILPSPYENEGMSRRAIVLNKIYMEQITLMLNSGMYGRQFDDLGIEITKVNFASGFNFLNLYWITRKQDIPEHVINETLRKALVELQEKMGDIGVTSRVPLLKFVKDLRLEKEIQLEKIFQSADFGRDFEPIYGKKVLTQDFAPAPSEMPVMRQNVLGLDHAKIKGRILAEIVKFKAINTSPPNQKEEDDGEEVLEMPHKLIKFSKNEFFKFYKRRRILALKMRKKEKQAGDNIEFEYVNTCEFVDENVQDEDVDVYEEENEEEDKSQFKT